MSIVAISETAGSLGNEIGRRLAERLGYRFADREIIAKASSGSARTSLTSGTPPKRSRRSGSASPTRSIGTSSTWKRSFSRWPSETMSCWRDSPRRSSCARLARAAGPRQCAERIRADRVEQQQGLTREAALDHVRQTDHERAARVKFLYQVSVDDPFLYDIVVNTERLTADEGARLLREALQQPRFQTSADHSASSSTSASWRARRPPSGRAR